MNNNDTEFQVGRRYRVAVELGVAEGLAFGGCDVKLGDEFIASHVDDDGAAWSTDVTFHGAPPLFAEGWRVAGRSYLRLGYVVPVADEVAG